MTHKARKNSGSPRAIKPRDLFELSPTNTSTHTYLLRIDSRDLAIEPKKHQFLTKPNRLKKYFRGTHSLISF